MASAVLPSRNEPNWPTTSTSATPMTSSSSHRPMGKFPPFHNPNPNPNYPNHNNFSRKQPHFPNHPHQNGSHINNSAPAEANFSHYVSYDISGYSRSEIRKLKSQLISELDKVRNLTSRFDNDNRNVSTFPNPKKRPSPFPPKDGPTATKRVSNGKPEKEKGAPPPPPYEASGAVMKLCSTVLTKLMKQKMGYVFNTPVDVIGMGLHDYHTIVKRPMDLGTIKSNMERNVYVSPEDFAADVRLTFNNALLYNPKGHAVHTLAEQYLALFEKWYVPIFEKFQGEKQLHLQMWNRKVQQQQFQQAQAQQLAQRQAQAQQQQQQQVVVPSPKPVEVEEELQGSSWSKNPSPEPPKVSKPSPKPDPVPALLPTPAPAPAPVPAQRREASPAVVAPGSVGPAVVEEKGRGRGGGGKLPKPKAKDPNKRDMSMEEKHKLGAGLQSLPEEKMSQVISIIRKRNGHLTQDGDEIELDIEAVDKETLWELDRFVTNYKKAVSKIRRQSLLEPLSANNVGGDDGNQQGGMSDRMAMETAKAKKGGGGGGDVGEEDVDIGDEMPASHFPPVEIDKDDDRQQQGGGGGDSSSSGSSSSSSSDDSSSSDSDSGSSSGSDSDVDDAQSRDNESKNIHH